VINKWVYVVASLEHERLFHSFDADDDDDFLRVVHVSFAAMMF